MATDPRQLLASRFNTGIVPVQRTQPSVNDGGEAARLATARVSQMAPPVLDRTQIVPAGVSGGAPKVMPNLTGPVATNVMAPIQEQDKLRGMDRAMEAMGPQRAANFQQRMAEHDARKAERLAQRQLRREGRAARIAEIMANRGNNFATNRGLLAQGGAGFAPGEPYPYPRRG